MIKRLAACLSSALFFAVLIAPSPAFAQSLDKIENLQPLSDPVLSADDEIRVIHITDRLARMPEVAAALQAYREAKALGLPPVAKTAVSYDIGDEKEFNVMGDLLRGSSWKTLTFTLVAKSESDSVNLWVANDQRGVASEEQLAQLSAWLTSGTPDESWRPEKGLIANNKEIFGNPPVSPGTDGYTNVLLFDIEEGTLECCILGYVSLFDLEPNPDPGEGNAANVVYADLPDGLHLGVSRLAAIIAHEHQHLIHFEYAPRRELTFVNEGLSEWAEILNGLSPRSIRYLNDPDEIRVRLLSWDISGAFNSVASNYERSGLFTTYLAERIGPEATGSIVRAKCPSGATFCSTGSLLNGVAGYDLILGERNLALADIVADFHTANFVNDAGVGGNYAYTTPSRQAPRIKATPTVLVDAEVDSSPSQTTVNVQSGAVDYLTWENVTNLEVEIRDFKDTDGGTSGLRSDLSLRLFTETDAGTKQLADLDPDTRTHTVSGEYARVTLIVANTRVSESSSAPPIKLDITGNWGGAAFDATTVAYETGSNEDRVFLRGTAGNIYAQRYEAPSNARLATVFVAPVYDNQFRNNNAPPGAPRDFTLKVWNAGDDGFPGNELYSMDVDESPDSESRIARDGKTYSFMQINLPSDEEALSTLPERIFIGLANKGTDNNYLAATFARSTVQGTLAYWGTTYTNRAGIRVTGWNPVALLRLCRKSGGGRCDPNDNDDGWFYLDEQVFPIRARFFALSDPLSTDDPTELPYVVKLAQNYPNPFNPGTSISWTQPASGRVRLSVYNLLGQNMATLADGLRPAGEHEVQLDASGWPSGVYIYALETGTHMLTRRMVLLK